MEEELQRLTQKSGKFRAFCLTINNWQDTDLVSFEQIIDAKSLGYMIVGAEVGAEGTRHLQAYIQFTNPRALTAITKHFKRAHVEVAKGTAWQNFVYCSKEEIILEAGERPKEDMKKGKRTDIIQVKQMVKDGKSLKEIYEVATSYQSYRMAEIGIKLMGPKRNWKPEVKWYWGSTGSGKTKSAFEEMPNAWVSGRDGKFWEGYWGQEDIILDDFRADFCKFHELLRILDRYEYRIEVKGGSQQLLAKRIIITSPYKPELVYKTREDIGQLLRRIDLVKEFGTNGPEQRSGGNSNLLTFTAPQGFIPLF